jgi:WD40 repeat protein
MGVRTGQELKEPLPITYSAFLSYSHAADSKLATALRQALHRFAKRPFQLRALRVFCDTSNIAANPGLWPAIEDALLASEYLILFASPQAAASPWVQREVDSWTRNKPAAHLLIALTAGEIVWENEKRDFDWSKTTALPLALSQLFGAEPLWVDFRWVSGTTNFPSQPRFRDCVADLAAPLHGRAKDELIGEDLRQARRMRRSAWATIILLALLATGFGWMSIEAENRRRIAAVERDRALMSQSHYLANAALRQITEGEPESGVLLAVEALPRPEQDRPYAPQAEAALYSTLSALGPRKTARVRVNRPVAGAVSYSPDGKRMVLMDGGNNASIHDALTGQLIRTLTGHEKPVWYALYLPDGSGVVTVSVDNTARLWNPETGAEIRVFRGHHGPILYAAISGDGRLLATASTDATARVWQIGTGVEVATLRGHTQPVCCIQMTPYGRRVATASMDGTVRLWDTTNGKTLAVIRHTPKALSSIAGQAVMLRFSPDGRLLATSHTDQTVRLWDSQNGKIAAVLPGGTAEVQDGAFSSDNRLFAQALGDNTTRVWRLNWEDDEHLAPVADPSILQQKRDGPPREQNAVAFDSEGRFVATASEYLETWDPINGSALATLKLDAPAQAMFHSQDTRRFAICHLDEVSLWEITGVNFVRWRGRQTWDSVPREDPGPVIETTAVGSGFTWEDKVGWEPPLAISRDAKFAAIAPGRHLVILDGLTGRSMYTIEAHTRVISQALFDHSGDRLVTASYDGTAKVWNVHNGANLWTLTGHQGRILDAALSPTEDLLGTASEDHTVRLWSLKDGSNSILRSHAAPVRRVAFSRDGKRLVTVSEDHTARVWDVHSHGEIAILHGDQGGFGVAALDASGDRVLTAGIGKDFSVRLFETGSGRELHRWRESKGTVLGLAFSSDGQIILTWGADGLARLRRALGQYDQVSNIGFGCAGPGSIVKAFLSQDGTRAVTVLRNGRTDLWDSRSGTSVLTLHTFLGADENSGCRVSVAAEAPEAGSVAVSPDLRTVLVAGDDDALALFSMPGRPEAIKLARKLVPRTLTVEERRRFLLA